MNEDYLEIECADEPDDWRDNIILRRDGRGRVYELIVPDDAGDTEVDKDAGNH